MKRTSLEEMHDDLEEIYSIEATEKQLKIFYREYDKTYWQVVISEVSVKEAIARIFGAFVNPVVD